MVLFSTQIKKPRVCGQQVHRQNCVSTDSDMLDKRTVTEVHFRVNLTIPLLDDLVAQLKERYGTFF